MVTDAEVTVLIDGDEHASSAHLGVSERARFWVDTRTGQLRDEQ